MTHFAHDALDSCEQTVRGQQARWVVFPYLLTPFSIQSGARCMLHAAVRTAAYIILSCVRGVRAGASQPEAVEEAPGAHSEDCGQLLCANCLSCANMSVLCGRVNLSERIELWPSLFVAFGPVLTFFPLPMLYDWQEHQLYASIGASHGAGAQKAYPARGQAIQVAWQSGKGIPQLCMACKWTTCERLAPPGHLHCTTIFWSSTARTESL